jgi:CHAT domain-containing protein
LVSFFVIVLVKYPATDKLKLQLVDLLNADLVVLSGGASANGKITGDGVIGLPRAFIAAGAKTVVGSIWEISDKPTVLLLLMTEFYKNLQTNLDKSQALQKAMLTMIKQYPNPRDWAAFTLIGDKL